MADIIEQVLADDRRIRRLLGALDDAVRYSGETAGANRMLAEVWERLAEFLELRAEAWKEICHLALSRQGQVAAAQMQEVVADHKDICEAIRKARLHSVDSAAWWRMVTAALRPSSDQITRAERGALAVFGHPRHPLAALWARPVGRVHRRLCRDARTRASGAAAPRESWQARWLTAGPGTGHAGSPGQEGGQAGICWRPARVAKDSAHPALPANAYRGTADMPFIIQDQFRPHHSTGAFHAFH